MKYLTLIRASHWIKNTFIFIPLFFAGKLFYVSILIKEVWGFAVFSAVASGIYIINDYRDRKEDRLHPVKKHRPLAAKTISANIALIISALLITVAISGSYLLDKQFSCIIIVYFILNLAYSFGLKNIPIVDISVIALGFVLRVKAGSVLGSVPLSMWLIIMVFLLSLFMALGKRRDDIILKGTAGVDLRKSISGYNIEFLNITISLVCAVILVCYLMYTISPEVDMRLRSDKLPFICFFVFIGVFRYLQLIFVNNDSGSPTKIIYKDLFLQVVLLLWLLSFYLVLYLKDL